MTLNDTAWDKVIAYHQHQLDTDGHFLIDSADLKALAGREPRLLAKHDFRTSQPQVFLDQGLGIVPVSRSRYLVGHFDLFTDLPAIDAPVRYRELPAGIESLNLASLSSEAVALNAAQLTGMVEDFLGCAPLHATVAGRMSTLQIQLRLGGVDVTVDRAQMEIDGGFESVEHLVLIEAKNHLAGDFNIRQLYFPFRRFQQALSKEVIPLYLVYTNGIFHLYRFEFPDPANPRSIQLRDTARYALTPSRLDAQTLHATVRAVTPESEPTVPFPQANSLARIINLLELLPLTKQEITDHYDFNERQARYYSDALRYLGLAQLGDAPAGEEEPICVTEAGQRILDQPTRDARNLAIIRALSAREVFREALLLTFAAEKVPGQGEIVGLMQGLGLSRSTSGRRASTVRAWAKWALGLITPTLL